MQMVVAPPHPTLHHFAPHPLTKILKETLVIIKESHESCKFENVFSNFIYPHALFSQA